MTTYYDDPVKDRAVKNYLRSRRRNARAVPARRKFLALGGPFNEQVVMLTPTTSTGYAVERPGYTKWYEGVAHTATLRVGNQVGRYVQIPESQWARNNLLTRLPRGVVGQLIWEAHS